MFLTKHPPLESSVDSKGGFCIAMILFQKDVVCIEKRVDLGAIGSYSFYFFIKSSQKFLTQIRFKITVTAKINDRRVFLSCKRR